MGAPRQASVNWPTGLRITRIRTRWFGEFARLEPGLNLHEIAKRLGVSYTATWVWASAFGYRFPDRRGRRRGASALWDRVDWSLNNSEIARQVGRSPERVRQVRAERPDAPPLARARKPATPAVPVVPRVAPPQPAPRNLDWRLPDSDLAAIWGCTRAWLVATRRRLKFRDALWHRRDKNRHPDPNYTEAIQKPRKKAAPFRHRLAATSGRPARP